MSNPDYDHNNLYSAVSEDKGHELRLGVWQGNASFAVFTKGDNNGGGKNGTQAKVPLNIPSIRMLAMYLDKLLTAAPGAAPFSFNIENWNPQEKKMQTTGSIALGKDDKSRPYIGIAQGQAKFKFIMRFNSKIALPSDASEQERTILAIQTFRDALVLDTTQAIIISKFKRQQQGGGNGGKPSYGGGSSASVEVDGIPW